MRIALLSDTHNHLPPGIFKYFDDCHEIWHAGDVGTVSILDELKKHKPVRAVYGNIDGADVRKVCPENLVFNCEGVIVYMTHIGGYPGRYAPKVRERIERSKPGLFICGHSHILKVMPDKKYNLLHINPGAAGFHGFHKVKTFVKFTIAFGKISDLQVIELGPRTASADPVG